jgi:hypothetical protein
VDKYGLRTARGIAGGRKGEKVDWPMAKPAKEHIKKLEIGMLTFPTGHNLSLARFTQDDLDFHQELRRLIA